MLANNISPELLDALQCGEYAAGFGGVGDQCSGSFKPARSGRPRVIDRR